MNQKPEHPVIDQPQLRGDIWVFRDRIHAGEVMAEMLADFRDSETLVLGIPSGGIPVAAEIARRLRLELDTAVVSKITLPWNTEAGYGAVAFDGTLWYNAGLTERLGLSQNDVETGIQETRRKVERRMELLRGDRPFPRLTDRTVVLVDDGLATGSTMRVAIRAIRKAGASRRVVAVPTGHGDSVRELAEEVDALYCANVREGYRFAVAEAYRRWRDEKETAVAEILRKFWERADSSPP
ncbi:MAG: phosphoribosyltransferase [Nitrospinaceae bacterium]|nr:phosphoribosyltransferase [Nitrospinaceae bacterium]NIS83679.1 phosphoribosyltransferase [Nitrospinaceae bacterium]NIT80478.1 phosphoribosyltransferase [Nitrospinaceae bacterium]NIU94877.1 phosphoribosyltransferase [Nitrospinaceae bacterium]NIY13476.1 phosphoribosyltransferase [Nitrospinaceae bacterium]